MMSTILFTNTSLHDVDNYKCQYTAIYIYYNQKHFNHMVCSTCYIFWAMVGKDNLWLLRATALVPRPPKSPLTKRELVKQAGASLPGSSNLDFLFFKPYFCKHVHITWKVRTKSVRFGCNVLTSMRVQYCKMGTYACSSGKYTRGRQVGGTAGTNTKVVRATNTRVALAEIQRKWNGSIRRSSGTLCPVSG